MRRLSLLSILLLLAACADVPSRYGTFVPINPATRQALAVDAADQLARVFPPALNRFNLQAPILADGFAPALTRELQQRGYAVAQPTSISGTSPAPGTTLGYVITAQGDALICLTLYLGPQTLSRAYVLGNGTTYAAGAWTRKE